MVKLFQLPAERVLNDIMTKLSDRSANLQSGSLSAPICILIGSAYLITIGSIRDAERWYNNALTEASKTNEHTSKVYAYLGLCIVCIERSKQAQPVGIDIKRYNLLLNQLEAAACLAEHAMEGLRNTEQIVASQEITPSEQRDVLAQAIGFHLASIFKEIAHLREKTKQFSKAIEDYRYAKYFYRKIGMTDFDEFINNRI